MNGLGTSDRLHRSSLVRMPVFWLAITLFVASLAGCIVTIMLARGGSDGMLPGVGDRLLSMPTAQAENVR